ncbi:MAG: hypothetical protein DYG94_05915 [Leptolyngbya sp. PLA3]|nr:MAG: hypothetical protein EDM82_03655 [Cyanobacteria bacterium CYA]MCE7968265.1 hypothetical protein [Leptolyngbya sp. PL-A3]
MDPGQKQKVIGALAVLLLLAGSLLIVRALLPPRSAGGGELNERAQRGLGAAGALNADPSQLPPRGNMTDDEYARHLMHLREEADRRAGESIEPGSARGPAKGG